jgi:phthiocerol/phenolphthiocerol synthesis type-I polyketide synthase C
MPTHAPHRDPNQLLAIVGMAGRFPGAADVDSLWRLLVARGDAIRPIPADRWDASAPLDPDVTVPGVGGFLDGIDQFDPTFFGISPREAEDIDPQQRLLLEVTWQTLEDAGRPAASLRGSRTGVYVGASWHDYELVRKERGARATSHSAVGSALDVIAARVSYFLGLQGPSMAVETGCSSSLVALDLACQALRGGRIDGALVGGVNLILAPDVSVALTRFGGLSPDGRCQAFAASANGFARGEGVIAIYVKTLARALADGDRIRGVIVATAVNNDGGGASLVTPSPTGQLDLLTRAYREADVAVDQLVYVEAHGTGTAVGDPIEAGAIGTALGQPRDRARGPLAIGSVKTNIGHLEAAAGLAGLVKTVLALEHRLVPPSLHSEVLNPAIAFDALNLTVVREPLALPATGEIFAGVSSFGWGGTNAHVILASAPLREVAAADARDASDADRTTRAPLGPIVVPLSAHSDDALRQRAADLRATIADDATTTTTPPSLDQLAGTLAWQRDHLTCRAAVVATSTAELATRLAVLATPATPSTGELPGVVTGTARAHRRTAFVFPGQGAQWIGMGRALFATSPTFAAVIRRCAAALAPHVGWDLVACIAHDAVADATTRVDIVQPVLWAMSVALAELWREAGIAPDVVVGHSQGEIAAATVAGALSYDDAARIVARRSQIVRRKAGQGAMLAVELDPAAAHAALAGFEDLVSLAAHNGPTSCVLSGDAEAVSMLHELLSAEGTFCRPVKVDYASHSHHMDDLAPALLAALDGIAPAPATTAVMSSTLARLVDGSELDASYWMRNLRAPVQLAGAIAQLLDDGVTHLVEISPHPVLAPALEQLAAQRPEPARVLSTLRRDAGTLDDLALTFARAFVAGLAPFGALPAHASVALPSYPWQRRPYRLAPGRRVVAPAATFEPALVPAPGEHDTWHGAIEIALDAEPWLADHKVHDAVVLPGTAMLAIALGAARARTGALPAALVDVRFRRDLTLTGGDLTLTGADLTLTGADLTLTGGDLTLTGADLTLTGADLTLTGADLTLTDTPARVTAAWRDDVAGGGSFALLSLAPGATSWTEHTTARVQHDAPSTDRIAFPGHLRAQPPRTAEAFYRACAARGLPYGPAFQGVARLFVDGPDGNAALGDVRLPDSCRRAARPHCLHPALWDAALQVCLALCDDAGTVAPIRIARVALLADLAAPITALWSYAVRRDATTFDVTLFDTDEQPVMTIEGLTLEPLAVAPADADRVLHLRFHDEPRGPITAVAPLRGSWLVCGDARDGAQTLVDALRHASTDAQLAADPSAALAALRAHPAPTGVVLVAPRDASGLDAQRSGLVTLTALANACVQLPAPPRLVVVTAHARAATADDMPDPGAALYVGFVRVLGREHPALSPLVIDIASTDASWATDCAAELAAPDGEDQVALRAGRRFVARLVRGNAEASEPPARAWTTPAQPFRLHAAAPGLLDAVEYRPLARRAPAAGEIEIEVTAASLNFIDVMKAMGTYPGSDGTSGALGGECAGRVVGVGPGVTTLAIGDRVVACAFGSFASHVTVRADHAQRIDLDAERAGLDDATAAALPLVVTTAWYALHDLARLAPGESVLIHAATGGLGLAAIAVARRLGARILATAGTAHKRAYLASLGITDIFDSRDLSWADGVRAATGGRGVDVVLNSLTGAAISLGLDVLAEDGRFIEVGKQDIYRGRRVALTAFQKGITFAAVDLAGLMQRRPARFAAAFAAAWAEVRSGAITPLPTTSYTFAEAREALRTMARGQHIGKLVLTAPDTVRDIAPEALRDGRFRSDATYLVTGGLGALGLSLAEHMAARGAGALALAGRSAPNPDAQRRIDAVRARGVRVETFALDVADGAAVERTLAEIRTTMPALRGVVHAAGVLDDATIANLTAAQLARVLAPKVDGARHLDAATAGDALDLFVMFSSAAALVGNAGQAAYAAANAFLDALAVARRREGRPGLSVQWGPVAERDADGEQALTGLAAHGGGARLAERGMGAFTPDDAWRALAGFLDGDQPVVGYVPLDLRRWFDTYPETAAQGTWRLLRRAATQPGAVASGTAFRAELEASPAAARRDVAEAKVRELASRVLRLDPAALDGETPLKALGLDSLMGLELRNRLESAFALKLSPTLLWTYGSSRALASVLCERVFAPAS